MQLAFFLLELHGGRSNVDSQFDLSHVRLGIKPGHLHACGDIARRATGSFGLQVLAGGFSQKRISRLRSAVTFAGAYFQIAPVHFQPQIVAGSLRVIRGGGVADEIVFVLLLRHFAELVGEVVGGEKADTASAVGKRTRYSEIGIDGDIRACVSG